MVLVNGELCHHPLRQLQVGDVISFRDINLKRRLAYFFMRRLVKFQSYMGLDSTFSRKNNYRKGKYNHQLHKGKGFQDRRFKKGKHNQKHLPFNKKAKDRAKFRKNDFKNKSFQKGKPSYPRIFDKPKKPRYNPFEAMPRRTFSNVKKVKKKKQKKKKLGQRSPVVLKRLNEQRIKKMSPILLTHLGGLRQYNLIFLPRLLAIQVVDKAYLLKNVYYPNALDFEVLKVHFKSLS